MLIRTSRSSVPQYCRESSSIVTVVFVALAIVFASHSCLPGVQCQIQPGTAQPTSSPSPSLSPSSSSILASNPSNTTKSASITTESSITNSSTTPISVSIASKSPSSSTPTPISTTTIVEEPENFPDSAIYHETTTKAEVIDYSDKLPEHVISDIMPDYVRDNGGILVHILLLIYVSLSLGIICDVYFLTSIELIGEKLQLPPDIAGATFMALGTSAPELFVGLIGVFITQDDIGTSTILGSAVFNMIFVPAVCGFAIYFSGMKMPKISKYSILRDAIYYMIAIIVVLLVMKDNVIDWVESLCMLLVFAVYLTILYFIAQLGELEILDDEDETSSTESNERSPLLSKNHSFIKSTSVKLDASQTLLDLEKSGMEKSRERRASSVRPRFLSMNDECESNVEGWVEGNRFIKFLMFPALLCFRLTVPKPHKYSCSYLFTFIISIIWISFFTYAAVWLVDIIGYTFRLPQTVVGLTILAAGSSIPEVISSVLVVKRGLANMALCNLFGSNIFDILVCLGLPWLIKSCMNMVELGTISLEATHVTVHSHGLLLTILTLLVSVLAYLITLSRAGWRLGLTIGIACSFIYVITISLATIYEIFLN